VLTITQHICSMKNKSTKYTQLSTNKSRLDRQTEDTQADKRHTVKVRCKCLSYSHTGNYSRSSFKLQQKWFMIVIKFNKYTSSRQHTLMTFCHRLYKQCFCGIRDFSIVPLKCDFCSTYWHLNNWLFYITLHKKVAKMTKLLKSLHSISLINEYLPQHP